MSRPRVEVLLAAYNGRPWLDEQIASLVGQVDVDVTVTISVDRSSDDTEGRVDEWCRRDDRLRSLPHGHRSGGAAPNFYRLIREVDASHATHVAFSDQDDIWLPQKLARACDLLGAEHEPGGYSSNVWVWRGADVHLLNKAQPQRSQDHWFSSAGPGCTYVLTGETYRRFRAWTLDHPDHGGVDMHDWLMYAWARSHDVPWVIDETPAMLYRQHTHNQVGANRGLSQALKRLADMRNTWYLDQVSLICDLLNGPSDSPVRMSGTLRERIAEAARVGSRRRGLRDRAALAAATVSGQLRRSTRG